MTLLNTAMQYRDNGFSVIAIDALKQSIGKWKMFQDRQPAPDELFKMIRHPATYGIALVTGKASGNLEVIDIDAKNFIEGCLYVKFCAGIAAAGPGLLEKLVIAQSRNGGYHMYYRCTDIENNQLLARRPATEQEKLNHPGEKVKVLIETRGVGGYIIVPPTPGYRFLQLNLDRVPEVSKSERDFLLRVARGLNKIQEKRLERRPLRVRPPGSLSPLDDYNIRGDIIGLLQKHGWTVTGRTNERTFFKRPGDSDQRSSGSFNHSLNYFSVFSTSTEFVPKAGYRPYAVYAVLECGGDFSLAYKRLASEGFGQSLNLKTPQNKSLKI